MSIEGGQRAVLLGVVEDHPALEVCSSAGQISKKKQGGPQRMVGLQEERGVLDILSQMETLLPELSRRLVLPPQIIKLPEPPQYREELRRLSHLLTEYPCPVIGVFHLRGGKALSHHQRGAESGLQAQFSLCTLGRVGEGGERL
jgi:hypothetical protein